MKTIRNYLHYRRLGIRNPGTVAGVEKVVAPFIQGAVVAGCILLAYNVVNHTVEASQRTADLNAAEKLKKQATYIAALEKTLARCLSGGDNIITIGNELWACGATNTGVKTRP